MTAGAGDALSHGSVRSHFQSPFSQRIGRRKLIRAPIQSGYVRQRLGHSFRRQTHGLHVPIAGTSDRPDYFLDRITCAKLIGAGDDFVHQYFKVIEQLIKS